MPPRPQQRLDHFIACARCNVGEARHGAAPLEGVGGVKGAVPDVCCRCWVASDGEIAGCRTCQTLAVGPELLWRIADAIHHRRFGACISEASSTGGNSSLRLAIVAVEASGLRLDAKATVMPKHRCFFSDGTGGSPYPALEDR